MAGEELPDYFAGVDVVIDLAYEKSWEVLRTAGPGVASAADGVDDDFGVLFTASVDVAVNGSTVGITAGKIGGIGLLAGLVVIDPEVSGVGEGDVASMSAGDVATFDVDEWIVGALHEQDRNGMRWMADRNERFRHGCGHGGDSGNLGGEVAGEALREESAVGNSGGVDASGIDGIRALQIGDQGAHEGDIIGGREVAGIVPVPVDALGIGDEKGAGVCQTVESSEAGHVVVVASTAVKDEEKRGRMVPGDGLRNVKEVGASGGGDLDYALQVVGVSAFATLAAGGVRGLRAGLCDGAGRSGEERTP